jgi:hypothetical protein
MQSLHLKLIAIRQLLFVLIIHKLQKKEQQRARRVINRHKTGGQKTRDRNHASLDVPPPTPGVVKARLYYVTNVANVCIGKFMKIAPRFACVATSIISQGPEPLLSPRRNSRS